MELDFGPVMITGGRYKDRIGCYDNDDTIGNIKKAVVYFGSILIGAEFKFINYKYLCFPSNSDLLKRRDVIYKKLNSFNDYKSELVKKVDLLFEFSYIENVLSNRMFEGKYGTEEGNKGRTIFISHSSRDNGFARMLADELVAIGYNVWLDEWKIKAGESIVQKISEGIGKAEYIVVILSEDSVKSGWVEKEWQAKYWDEVQNNKIYVIPVLYKKCLVPVLLKPKKYADFSRDYNEGLEELLYAINSFNR